MLIKLIKHDLKNTLKFLSIFYGLSILFAILTRIFWSVDNSLVANIIGSICSGVTISMIFNIIINNLLRCWVRFRQSMYGDEGYLTHTLPIKKHTLYLAKFLLALITMLISVLVIGISLFIAYYSKDNIEVIKSFLFPIANIYNSTITGLIVVILLIFFLEVFNMLQSGYTGIILGHKMQNHKNLYSILYGFVAYTITQVFALLVLFIFALFNQEIMNLFVTNTMVNQTIIKNIILSSIIIYSLNIIAYYILNFNLLKKGVNID